MDKKQALDFTIETLKPAALKFHAKYGTTPTMFIDGADLLAKYDKKLFIELLIQAKALANEGVLTIVLVSRGVYYTNCTETVGNVQVQQII